MRNTTLTFGIGLASALFVCISQPAPAATPGASAGQASVSATSAPSSGGALQKVANRKAHRLGIRHHSRKYAMARRHRLEAAAASAAGLTKRHVQFYVPLVHPGMVRRYDIAGWHADKTSGLLRTASPSRLKMDPAPSRRGWYVPSAHPGMWGRYDIRKTHTRPETL